MNSRLFKTTYLSICLLLTLLFTMSQGKSTTSYILSIDNPNEINIDGSIMQNFKNLVSEFNGKVTHEYSLINGLSFEIDDNTLSTGLKDKLQSLGQSVGVVVNVEKDQDVHAFSGKH